MRREFAPGLTLMSTLIATPTDEVKPRATRCRPHVVVVVTLVVAAALFASSSFAGVPRPLRDALQSRSAKVRILGITGVARSGDAEAAALLKGMLADVEPSVRVAAVDAIASLRDPSLLVDLQALTADSDATVRKAVARGAAALEALVVFIDTGDVDDLTDRSVPELLPELQRRVEQALGDALGPVVVVRRGGVARGYGAVLRLREMRRLVQDGDGAIEVKCDVTLVELPGRILRFTSSATAAAGVVGPLPRTMERELALDGIAACAPSLARDVADYVRLRARR